MASNRIIPPGPEQLMPEEAPDNHLAEKELDKKEERKLNTALRAGFPVLRERRNRQAREQREQKHYGAS